MRVCECLSVCMCVCACVLVCASGRLSPSLSIARNSPRSICHTHATLRHKTQPCEDGGAAVGESQPPPHLRRVVVGNRPLFIRVGSVVLKYAQKHLLVHPKHLHRSRITSPVPSKRCLRHTTVA